MEGGQVPISENVPPSDQLLALNSNYQLARVLFFVLFIGLIIFLPIGVILSKKHDTEKAALLKSQLLDAQANQKLQMDAQTNQNLKIQSDAAMNNETTYKQPENNSFPAGQTAPTTVVNGNGQTPQSVQVPVRQLQQTEIIGMIQNALVKVTDSIKACKAGSGLIGSQGTGGMPLCDFQSDVWPVLEYCGQWPSDTKYIVFNSGTADNWDVTIVCRQVQSCNGPENAICNKNGCTFKGTCPPVRGY